MSATTGGNEGTPGPHAERVVLRFRDGRAVPCRLVEGFTPGAEALEAVLEDGTRLTVALDELKAVFFLKDPKRRRVEMELDGPAPEVPPGAPARVEFQDGEIIHGRVEQYSIADRGFFLYPVARESNNERIFVVATALTSLVIEG